MSVKVETLEHNMAKMTIEVSAEDFIAAMKNAYNKQKKSLSLPGFRKGKVPMALAEQTYGPAIFYDDAANECINNTYPAACTESGLDIVSYPEIGVEQIEKGKPFIYTAAVAVKPAVTLGEYKGLEVPKVSVEVSDEEVDASLKAEQEKNARLIDIEDRAVENGDTIVLDYSGAVDGVKFDGGTAEDQTLVIGSGSFIPGFEDQLIGVNAGESKDVVVTFPTEYHAEELAGKEAVFACTVKKIQAKELPALDDDFAKDVSEFDTLDEYRADIRKGIVERKEAAAKTDKENAAVDKLIAASEMDIPQAMIDGQVEDMYRNMANNLQMQGISIDTYLQYMGQNKADFAKTLEPQALKRIQTRLVLEAVAEKEAIEIGDDKIEEELKKMAEAYNMEVEKLRDVMSDAEKEEMKKDLAVQEAVSVLTANAVEVEAEEEKKDAE